MPYIDTAIRQALGLAVNSPSLEDITAAASARGLQFDPHSLTLAPTAPPVPPSKRTSSAKKKQEVING